MKRAPAPPGSDKELEIEWFMNREFRLALLHDWTRNTPALAIDFTRYDLKAEEPQALQREWSLMNVLNQKGTRPQDKPDPARPAQRAGPEADLCALSRAEKSRMTYRT